MPYRVEADGKQRFKIAFVDESPNVVALRMAPESRERELQIGNWLVLTFAIWSCPDRDSIPVALRFARSSNSDRFRVGIRPFDDDKEFQTWIPNAKLFQKSISNQPIWMWIQNGKITDARGGRMSREELSDFVNR